MSTRPKPDLSVEEEAERERLMRWLRRNRVPALLRKRLRAFYRLRELGVTYDALAVASGVTESAVIQQLRRPCPEEGE